MTDICSNPDCHAQVAALVGALERRTPDNPYESGGTCSFCGSYDSHFPSCSWQQAHILLANLPAEALEIARRAQAHDDMAAEVERLRGALRRARDWVLSHADVVAYEEALAQREPERRKTLS